MGLLKALFSKKQPAPQRTLTSPTELQKTDIFCFGDSFALPQAMRKQQFQVTDIQTIEFQYEYYAQVIAEGASEKPIYLSFPKNPQRWIKCSLLLSRFEVEQLFDLEMFSEIFEEPGQARLKPITRNHEYADMLADEYIQKDFMTSGYLHEKDYRNGKPPQYTESEHGREFEFYSLEGAKEQRSIDIYIFANGDTDVYLSFLRPAADIAELWTQGASDE